VLFFVPLIEVLLYFLMELKDLAFRRDPNLLNEDWWNDTDAVRSKAGLIDSQSVPSTSTGPSTSKSKKAAKVHPSPPPAWPVVKLTALQGATRIQYTPLIAVSLRGGSL
jgi:hypothetical protein